MPGPCPHRPAGGLLQPRLGSKIVFLASRGIQAGEPAVLLDPAAARDQLARAGAGHRAMPRAQPRMLVTPDPTIVPEERQGNAGQARR
jgi:hypothetical protein